MMNFWSYMVEETILPEGNHLVWTGDLPSRRRESHPGRRGVSEGLSLRLVS